MSHDDSTRHKNDATTAPDPNDKQITALTFSDVIERSQARHINNKPALYTAEEVRNIIEEYIADKQDSKTPLNIQELALRFGRSVNEFKRGEGIARNSYTKLLIKQAFLACEASVSNHLLSGNSINLIFYAKNVFDWKDKQDISHQFGLTVKRVRYDQPTRLRKKAEV